MTSSNARRREPVLAYSGGVIDRASNHRSDPGWVDAILAADGARLIPMWRDQCIVSGEPAVPAMLAVTGAASVLNTAAETVFLGLDDDGGIFAADLSPLRQSHAVEAAGGERVLDVRGFVGVLRHPEAALLGYARGILHWNRHHHYCGNCGSATRSGHGGHLRACQKRGVRTPALPACRARGDHARGEPGPAQEVLASPAQGFGRGVVLDPGGLR
jgi:NAD+ diphosphatase